MKCYPKLFDAGGFECLLFQRGGGEDGGFHSQAKIYIRPLQKDICLKDDSQNLEQDLQEIIAGPVVDCLVCGDSILMNSMKEHQVKHNSSLTKPRVVQLVGSSMYASFAGIPVVKVDGSDRSGMQTSVETGKSCASYSTPTTALLGYQKEVIEEDSPRQKICVCRIDGANIKVRFEEEEAVGSGPVREYLVNAIKVVDEGILTPNGKPLIFFEGEQDHRPPIHDQSLRLMGTFKAVGRIIGHSVLHGGPGLQLDNCERSENSQYPIDISQTREDLQSYLMEAGLDPDNFQELYNMMIEGLMMFNVKDKRRMELLDIQKGMEEVSLITFLIKNRILTQVVFPTDQERIIPAEHLLEHTRFEEEDVSESNKTTAMFFRSYIKEIAERKEDGAQVLDLVCFWTGSVIIPCNTQYFLVKFDAGEIDLPLSETCF
ncbi:E3 ubiquitin- ligase UPL2-like [Paramuricea clavata]|uniref:E3 ubiquitin- ligase UPL2-like n=1 Tax=Paramuricea clavata TaxID=317549 RepID=A0A6S7HK09_PARCT|nr:E3 ubiquitin- ligase UPL2-like [Paramuricea clavata]